ncbi:serine protease snake-like isoform X2 [Toxorhynchites rutilus septentrionalis]|nr:serine protease snake-like isoform X2 [Toxorhynchites rutilus septentrionalis]XP_055644450.1 serine protease snake-like isoform X2 [Toxorhynchites rutilus septentrionalis]XP_055644451.1 serine protease snake-like isoform X2 [Toxorhynchites rutilus septentrionalis]
MRTTIASPLLLNPFVIKFESSNCSTSVDLIVNGEAAKRGEFPHQALLGLIKESSPEEIDFFCGGSLISERHVLTAAHCEDPTVVRLGEHDLREDESQVDFEVDEMVRHPNYTLRLSYHDIALVRLNTAVMFSSFMRPACLWTSVPLNQSTVIATGFGLTEFAGNGSSILMKVTLDVMNKTSCEEKFAGTKLFKQGIRDEQLCVGSQQEAKDTCNGDSGGPIQVVTDSSTCVLHIVGVTSVGNSCGVGRTDSIYTEVARYIDWIEGEVWPGERRIEPKLAAEVENDHRIMFPIW